MKARVLIVPGQWNSGPDHWQSLWEAEEPTCRRIHQKDWNTPLCANWVSTIDAAVRAERGRIILVAHSLGCIAVAHWGKLGRSIGGALLVAPADVEAATIPQGPHGFAPVPLARLPFRTVVVSSGNDPYVSIHRARFFAETWGSAFVDIGFRGHINSSAGLGPWPEGRALLAKLLKKAG